MLEPNATLISRLGTFALGLALWPWARQLLVLGALPRHAPAVLLVIALFATSFALLLTALTSSERASTMAPRMVFPVLALVAVTAAYAEWLEKSGTPLPRTTDGHVYMDYAARLLLHGKNPYGASLLEAYRVFELPLRYSTPLVDGDISERVAYPALSFVVLVPFLLAGIPTYLVYGLAFLAAIAIVVARTPAWCRALVVALFVHDVALVSLGFDGVNDTIWVLLVVFAIVAWSRKPRLALVLLGLACAHKQQPWFLVPFAAWLVHRERRVPLWQLVALVGAPFVVFNLPFLVWQPRAWVAGILEPLVAPMITLSDGLTALTMTGLIVFPSWLLKGLFWLAYALAFLVYARHTRALRHWCWILPATALWFSNRALLSYWYFAALPALASFVALPDRIAEAPERDVRKTIRIASLVGAAVLAAVLLSSLRRPPFVAERTGPIETAGRAAALLRLRLTNTLSTRARPRFAMQGGAPQPLAWHIDEDRRSSVQARRRTT